VNNLKVLRDIMRRFKYVGSEQDAKDYGTNGRPSCGKIYSENEEFGGRLIAYWADQTDFVTDEWEEVVEESTHPTYSTVSVGGVGLTVEFNSEIDANTQVNPQHYKNGEVECIEAIKSAVVGKDGVSGYLVGNVIKYLWRYESKGKVTDLEKSNWYLNKLIDYEKNKER
jgi:hypothetical protein